MLGVECFPLNFIYRPIYWSYRNSSGLWHWASRRFTPAGLCVAGGWVVAGAVGVDIENTVTYQSFALLLAFLIFAFVCSFFFRAKFSATRVLPRIGTAGQPLPYQIQVKNLTAKTQAGLTLLDDLADPRPPFDEWLAFHLAESRRIRPFRVSQRRQPNPFRLAKLKAAENPPLAPKGEGTVTMELIPLRRGILHFAGVTVARPDPLGLFRSFSKVVAPQTVLILPKRYPLRPIHWRSWAKTGKPIVKEFEDEFFVRHALVLDTFTDEPHSELLEEAVSVAASFACTVLTQESLLDLLFVGNQSYCFTAGRGLGQADQMLEILAAVRNCAGKKFDALEHPVLNHLAVVSGCICVLQRWDGARRKFVEKLKAL